MSGTPLVATTEVVVVALVVDSAYGGAGALVDNSTDCLEALLINTGNEPIEYKVGGDAWVGLAVRTTMPLGINLSTTPVRLRMAQFARASSAQLNITRLTGTYAAGDDTVALGGGIGAAAFTDLTDAPATITANAVVCGNPGGTAVDFASSVSFDPEFRTLNNEGDDADGASYTCTSNPGGEETPYHIRIHSEIYPGEADGYVEISMGEGNAVNNLSGGLSLSYEQGECRLGLVGSTRLRVNGQMTPVSQEVLVAGVGTMTFTHGLLTGFTPA